MAQQVKDPASSLLGIESLLWRGFDPWPRNLHMLQMWPKKKKKKMAKRQSIFRGRIIRNSGRQVGSHLDGIFYKKWICVQESHGTGDGEARGSKESTENSPITLIVR